jgi:hypothetical protein
MNNLLPLFFFFFSVSLLSCILNLNTLSVTYYYPKNKYTPNFIYISPGFHFMHTKIFQNNKKEQ